MDTIDVIDPSTGLLLAEVPVATPSDVTAAVARARHGQHGWARVAPEARAGALRSAARSLRAHAEELAELQTREMGKPIGDSRGGVEAAVRAVEQYAELGPLHRGHVLQGAWEATDLMVPVPWGVVAAIVPWNDPCAIAAQAAAAAVVTGNACVLKPSERAPLAARRLAELVAEALPPGVLQVLDGGAAVGAALVDAPGVDVVLHVGSLATGRSIATRCASIGRRYVLELGGKDAFVVDRDVDPRWAAGQAAVAAFANSGQICVSAERLYVHREVAEPFVEALVAEARAWTVGDPFDPATRMGPLVDRAQVDHVHRHVSDAVAGGARVACGGAPSERAGAFYPPTVLTDVTDEMLVLREETFGPVAPVRVVDTFDEALELANCGDYGLAAVVLTASAEHAHRAWRTLQAGTVKVNAAFGGAPGGAAEPARGSGRGFGYGPELLDELTQTRVVHVAPAVPRGG